MISNKTIIDDFEHEIARQDNIVYGLALLFECLMLIHEDQPSVIETQKKQFRNMIQKGNEVISRAGALLNEAKKNPQQIALLSQFVFSPCQGHPAPQRLSNRAELLTSTYEQIFPNRPRSQNFTREEIFTLIEKASEQINLSD